MKNLTLWTLGLIATLSFFAGLPGPRATADPFGVGPPNAGWFADNANHSWCTYGSFVSTWYNPIRDSMYTLDVTTDMTRTYVSVQTAPQMFSFTFQLRRLWGWRTRDLQLPSHGHIRQSACGAARIRLNTDLLDTFSRRMKTSCHEVGHSVGLTHTSAYGGLHGLRLFEQ